MNRRIIFIILGALLLLALVGFVWFWFLARDTEEHGDLGSGGLRPAATSTGLGSGNNQSPYGYYGPPINFGGETDTNNNSQTFIPTPDGSIYGNDGGTTYASSTYVYTAPGVIWLGGGTFTNFNPTPINRLENANISGTPYIPNPQSGTVEPGYINSLLGVGAAGLVACVPGLLGGGVGALAGFLTGAPVNSVAQNVAAGNQIYKDFLDCVARTISRVAINQMTVATVNWINSGFDGKPAYVEDYEKFFADTADLAAGEFIKGSGLAFLCSPFKLQVKIAIAQSYASRRSGSGNQCTLTGIVNNVNNFVNGDFSQGGWGGLLAVTTEPTNNPFGAFMYAQLALSDAQTGAVIKASRRISDGGFLSQEEKYGCQTELYEDFDGSTKSREVGCKTRIVTPGKLIEARVQQSLDLPIDQNLLADSFDEVISALMNQLVIKTLQNGFRNLSDRDNDASPFDEVAMAAAQQLLTNLQEAVSLAQQYGAAQQGSIVDIQNAQAQLTNLQNCWDGKNNSTNADAAKAQVAALETRITVYNNNIVRANTAITKVQQLQSGVLSATTRAEVQAVTAAFTAAQSSGQLIAQAEVTSAQQNRTTLQSEMGALNNQTTAAINQCNAS